MYLVAKLPEGDRTFRLTEGVEWSIGRSFENDIILQDQTLSRCHATIRRFGLGFELEDHQSLNGTRINGIPLPPHRKKPVMPEQTIRFGGVECRLTPISVLSLSIPTV